MKKESVNQNNKNYGEKINFNFSLAIISLFLFFFFFLFSFHNWANSLVINLHFCDHILCIFYSIIWLFFGICNLINFYKEKKKFYKKEKETKQERKNHLKKRLIIFLVTLVIGIILMNIIPCDSSGKVNFSFTSTFNQKDFKNSKGDFLNNNFNYSNSTWISDILNCTDSDGGLVPEVRGRIFGLADGEFTETGSQDICYFGMLRELYCEDDNYFSLEIDCKEYFESDFAYCEEGVCKLAEEIDCQETCEFYGFSNSRGPFMNCSKCNSDESCNFFVGLGVIIYEGTPAFCCCSNEANILCEDYAVENGYEYWVLTEGDCKDVATVNCEVHGLSLDEFFVKFIAEEGDCCVWTCKNTPITNCTDNDGDHYWVEGGDCGLVDCDDNNPGVNPGAFENCDDGFDNDCDGLIDCEDPNCDWLETCKCENTEFPDCVGLCKYGNCQPNEEEKKCECV